MCVCVCLRIFVFVANARSVTGVHPGCGNVTKRVNWLVKVRMLGFILSLRIAVVLFYIVIYIVGNAIMHDNSTRITPPPLLVMI